MNTSLLLAWDEAKNKAPYTENLKKNQEYWWLCSKGHSVRSRLSLVLGGANCAYCANRKLLTGFNDLATLNPALAQELHPVLNDMRADELFANSNRNVWWQCKAHDDHVWSTAVHHRNKGSQCPFCTNKRVLPGFNDLASQYPTLVDEWSVENDCNPDEVTAVSGKKVKWVCSSDENHTWLSTVANRTFLGNGCPFCSGRKKLPEIDGIFSDPQVKRLWNNANDQDDSFLSKKSDKVLSWQCPDCLQTWAASVKSVVARPQCPHCDPIPHLGQTHPHLIAQWSSKNSKNITDVTKGSNYAALWVCDVGHEWRAYIHNRTIAGSSCPACSYGNKTSRGEMEVADFVNSLGFDVQTNVRIDGKEIDVYIPERKFGIEFNGVYWHSELFKEKNYHAEKLVHFSQRNIDIYQIWEDDWNLKREIIKKGLAYRLGKSQEIKIGARTLKPSLIEYKNAAEFLDMNHLQGRASGTYYFGLSNSQGILQAVLVATKTQNVGEFVIDRYATSTHVQGGFTKLLSYAQNVIGVTKWITFADLMVSQGNLYSSHGFYQDKVLDPDYYYVVNGVREHKFTYRKSRFKNDSALQYEEGLSERELAALNGLVRIWDAGKIRFVKDVT